MFTRTRSACVAARSRSSVVLAGPLKAIAHVPIVEREPKLSPARYVEAEPVRHRCEEHGAMGVGFDGVEGDMSRDSRAEGELHLFESAGEAGAIERIERGLVARREREQRFPASKDLGRDVVERLAHEVVWLSEQPKDELSSSPRGLSRSLVPKERGYSLTERRQLSEFAVQRRLGHQASERVPAEAFCPFLANETRHTSFRPARLFGSGAR